MNILLREAIKDLKASRASEVLGLDKTEHAVTAQGHPEGIDELGTALDSLQLGTTQEGAVGGDSGTDAQKDGTPV